MNSIPINDTPKRVPNIFSFAKSELSQDAMFAWLIQWADNLYMNIDPDLCKLGKSFLSLLTGIQTAELQSVKVKLQKFNIDILVEINEDALLVIEDKTRTSVHGDQLKRYKKVQSEYSGKRSKFYYAYVKIENEPLSILNGIQKEGYKTISREDLLEVLWNYNGANPLVIDYRNNLQDIENKTNNFTRKSVAEWKWHTWQGFYKELERHIHGASWGYVPNKSGGFLALWWNFVEKDGVEMYLQFEQEKLCVKIKSKRKDKSLIRKEYCNLLVKEAKRTNIDINRPRRFGTGVHMTIGEVATNYIFGSDKVDIDSLVGKLRKLENLVRECMK